MNDFSGGARVAGVEQCLRERDWSGSPLGAPSTWPPALAYAARFMFDSATPMFLAWGDALGVLYNDASVTILRGRHPARVAGPARLPPGPQQEDGEEDHAVLRVEPGGRVQPWRVLRDPVDRTEPALVRARPHQGGVLLGGRVRGAVAEAHQVARGAGRPGRRASRPRWAAPASRS